MDRERGKISGRCLDGTAGIVSLGEAPWQAGCTASSFPSWKVSALHRLKRSFPSVSVSIVDFSIVNTDWMNDNERDSSEHLEVW